MKVTKKELSEKYINILTTEKVNEILEKNNKGEKLHLNEKIWFDNKVGVRKAGLKFASTKKEIEEFTKCKMDIHYFANNYCQIKREDGTVGPMKLRDYQKDMIDLYQNKYCLLMASRQMGKCLTISTLATFQDQNGNIFNTNIGTLYYKEIKKQRKLTLLENVKLFLYYILSKIQ